MDLARLDKILSSQQPLSRKEAGKLIRSGAVTVDGQPVTRPETPVDPGRQNVAVLGRPLCYREHLYLMLNKPLGYVCSTDGQDGPSVLALVPPSLRRAGLFPAGRLDKASEGMVIITDDGDFAHRLLSPRRHVPKRYFVYVDRPVVNEALAAQFAEGMQLGGGDRCRPALLERCSPNEAIVTLREGLYHQIRRMFAQSGARVTRLVRLQIGDLALDEALKPGDCRPLTESELRRLACEPEPEGENR